MTEVERQQILDEEHLKLLRIGYFVSAGINAVFSLFFVFYAFIGLMFVFREPAHPSAPNQMPPEAGYLFMGVGVFMTVFSLCLAGVKYRVARAIERRRERVFCMVVAAVCCIGVPYGTLLSVLTFIVLGRPTVVDLFRRVPPIQNLDNVGHGA